jgi:hypothetical protein
MKTKFKCTICWYDDLGKNKVKTFELETTLPGFLPENSNVTVGDFYSSACSLPHYDPTTKTAIYFLKMLEITHQDSDFMDAIVEAGWK